MFIHNFMRYSQIVSYVKALPRNRSCDDRSLKWQATPSTAKPEATKRSPHENGVRGFQPDDEMISVIELIISLEHRDRRYTAN